MVLMKKSTLRKVRRFQEDMLMYVITAHSLAAYEAAHNPDMALAIHDMKEDLVTLYRKHREWFESVSPVSGGDRLTCAQVVSFKVYGVA